MRRKGKEKDRESVGKIVMGLQSGSPACPVVKLIPDVSHAVCVCVCVCDTDPLTEIGFVFQVSKDKIKKEPKHDLKEEHERVKE